MDSTSKLDKGIDSQTALSTSFNRAEMKSNIRHGSWPIASTCAKNISWRLFPQCSPATLLFDQEELSVALAPETCPIDQQQSRTRAGEGSLGVAGVGLSGAGTVENDEAISRQVSLTCSNPPQSA